MTLATQIEALLFASDQSLSLARLAELLPGASRAEIEAAPMKGQAKQRFAPLLAQVAD